MGAEPQHRAHSGDCSTGCWLTGDVTAKAASPSDGPVAVHAASEGQASLAHVSHASRGVRCDDVTEWLQKPYLRWAQGTASALPGVGQGEAAPPAARQVRGQVTGEAAGGELQWLKGGTLGPLLCQGKH